jgi:hypothetical protein
VPEYEQIRNVLVEGVEMSQRAAADANAVPLPGPYRVEIYHPRSVPNRITEVTPEFVATFLRWLGRVVPTKGTPVLLMYQAHYRFFRYVMEPLFDHGLIAKMIDQEFNDNAIRTLRGAAPGYADIRNAIHNKRFSHVFILCTHGGTSAVLRIMHQHVGAVPEYHLLDEKDDIKWLLPRGTVHAFDIQSADSHGNLIRYSP